MLTKYSMCLLVIYILSFVNWVFKALFIFYWVVWLFIIDFARSSYIELQSLSQMYAYIANILFSHCVENYSQFFRSKIPSEEGFWWLPHADYTICWNLFLFLRGFFVSGKRKDTCRKYALLVTPKLFSL